jgi:hypothetical protein
MMGAKKADPTTADELLERIEESQEGISAETIHEPTAMPDRDTMSEWFQFFDAESDKQYYLFNPNTTKHGRRNPIDQHYLMTRYWRPESVKREEGKVLVIVYHQGHPDNPMGGQQNVPPDFQIWSRPWAHKIAEDEKRLHGDNPGMQKDAGDVKYVRGPNGSMVLDTKNPVDPNKIGDSLPLKSEIDAREKAMANVREKMPDEFYDAVKKSTESKLAE